MLAWDRLTPLWMLILLATLVGASAWLFPGASEDNPPGDRSPIAMLLSESVTAIPEPVAGTPEYATASSEVEPPELAVAAVKRTCPWPPTPSTWRQLDAACLTVMARHDANDQWRLAFGKDPFQTRLAVVAALDDAACHVPANETKPTLQEACAAEAMVRLAALQDSCVYHLHWDPEDMYSAGRTELARDASDVSQEDYFDMVERQHQRDAYSLWQFHMCRSVADAAVWVDKIPPPADPLKESERSLRRNGGLPKTQAIDLREAARRLGYPFTQEELTRLAQYRRIGFVRLDGGDPAADLLAQLPPPDDPRWLVDSGLWRLEAIAARLRDETE